MENPDALAGAIGANTIVEIGYPNDTPELPPHAIAFLNAVTAMPAEDRLPLLEIAGDHYRAGQPIPPLFSYMAEARNWAALATLAELKAYCLASYEAMSGADQAAFLGHLDRRAAA